MFFLNSSTWSKSWSWTCVYLLNKFKITWLSLRQKIKFHQNLRKKWITHEEYVDWKNIFVVLKKWSLLCWNIWMQMEMRELPGAIFGRCSSHAFVEIDLHSFPEHQTKPSLFDPRFFKIRHRRKHWVPKNIIPIYTLRLRIIALRVMVHRISSFFKYVMWI